MTEKRSRNYHDHKRWKKNYLKLHRLRKKPVTDPLREEVTAIPCHEQTGAKKIRMEERGSGERALGAKKLPCKWTPPPPYSDLSLSYFFHKK